MNSSHKKPLFSGACLLLFIYAFLAATPLRGQDHRLGGSIRGYQFFSLEDPPFSTRRDSEIWLLRLTDSVTSGIFEVEAHGLLTLTSPPLTGDSRLAIAGTRTFLPLESELLTREDLELAAALDRLNLRLNLGAATLVVGRQAVSWGVTYFWPAMDLFAPFRPQQVDRDYKSGVDAVRVRFPLGPFSELEVLGAVLGSSPTRDGAAGALLRWNVGSADLGFMGGRFHRDTVAGAFVTANVYGSGLRGEVTWTDSGDPRDVERRREQFWRGAVGLDRQLLPSLTLISEVVWNGYGACDAERYLEWMDSDRILRGEVNGLGRIYSGTSLSWLAHPLMTVENSLLFNWSDRSALWVPALHVSTGNNSLLLAGGQVGLGSGFDERKLPESEYGSIPVSLFVSMRLYF